MLIHSMVFLSCRRGLRSVDEAKGTMSILCAMVRAIDECIPVLKRIPSCFLVAGVIAALENGSFIGYSSMKT